MKGINKERGAGTKWNADLDTKDVDLPKMNDGTVPMEASWKQRSKVKDGEMSAAAGSWKQSDNDGEADKARSGGTWSQADMPPAARGSSTTWSKADMPGEARGASPTWSQADMPMGARGESKSKANDIPEQAKSKEADHEDKENFIED